jgi:hypothetical protein
MTIGIRDEMMSDEKCVQSETRSREYVKRDLQWCQKRPTMVMMSDEIWSEARSRNARNMRCVYVKRDLQWCQKRHTMVSKETYNSLERSAKHE